MLINRFLNRKIKSLFKNPDAEVNMVLNFQRGGINGPKFPIVGMSLHNNKLSIEIAVTSLTGLQNQSDPKQQEVLAQNTSRNTELLRENVD
jgi:hypothetical protein